MERAADGARASADRESEVYMAKLAEQAERYDGARAAAAARAPLAAKGKIIAEERKKQAKKEKKEKKSENALLAARRAHARAQRWSRT